MVAITGMNSSSIRPWITSGLISVTSPTKPSSGSRAVGPDQPGIDAADADGVSAVHVDRRDELRVDLALEHHAGDVDGLGVGDAEAVDELGLLAEPRHQSRRSAARRRARRPAACRPAASARCPRRTALSASWSDVPASALPPYFTTTILPANRRMYGSASTSTDALSAGGFGHGVPIMVRVRSW